MKKGALLLLMATVAIYLFSFTDSNNFTGKIIYVYAATTADGTDITAMVAPVMGKEQHWMTDGTNYKSTDENKRLIQLYISNTNTYYGFDGAKLQKNDAAMETAKQVAIKHLDTKETIVGYKCKALEITTENTVTIYYYSPDLTVNIAPYAKHNYGEWNKYLKASKGALPLKFVTTFTAQGMVISATAQEVKKVTVDSSEFDLPNQ